MYNANEQRLNFTLAGNNGKFQMQYDNLGKRLIPGGRYIVQKLGALK
jgi:hypothetical protein